MKNKVSNKKTDEIAKKDVENHTNQNDGNNHSAYTYLKFISFWSTINQVIQSNLELQ